MEEVVKDRLNDCRATVLVSDDELLQRVPQEKIPSLQTILRVGDIEGRDFDGPPESQMVVRVILYDGQFNHYIFVSTGHPIVVTSYLCTVFTHYYNIYNA